MYLKIEQAPTMNDHFTRSIVANSPAPVVSFPCQSCGGQLQYEPGTDDMVCSYCLAREPIPALSTVINELDFVSHAEESGDAASTTEMHAVICNGCGAQLSLPSQVTAQTCAFCTTPLVIAQAQCQRVIKTQALLPFQMKCRVSAPGRLGKLPERFW